jgi:hypothetical protein
MRKEVHMCGKQSWVPLLIVGACLYWSVALGLGSLSLSFFSRDYDCACAAPAASAFEDDIPAHAGPLQVEVDVDDSQEPITVQLESYVPAGGGQQDPPEEDSIGRTAY